MALSRPKHSSQNERQRQACWSAVNLCFTSGANKRRSTSTKLLRSVDQSNPVKRSGNDKTTNTSDLACGFVLLRHRLKIHFIAVKLRAMCIRNDVLQKVMVHRRAISFIHSIVFRGHLNPGGAIVVFILPHDLLFHDNKCTGEQRDEPKCLCNRYLLCIDCCCG